MPDLSRWLIAAAASAVAVTGVVVVATRDPARPAAAPSPTPTRSESLSPSALPSSPSPTPTPTARVTSPPPQAVRRHTGIRPRLAADQLHDLRLAVHATPVRAPAATVVSLGVDVRLEGGMDARLAVDWGDGGTDGVMAVDCGPVMVPYPSPSPTASPSPTPSPTPYSWSRTFEHRFRYPGVYYAVVRAQHQCDGGEGVNARTVRIEVVAGPTRSNGPEPAVTEVGSNDYQHPATLSVWVNAGDADGWVTRVVVVWDDGTRSTRTSYPRSGCKDPAWQWPTSWQSLQLKHRFATKGRHTVKAYVASAGCDGKDVQYGRATAVVVQS